MLITAQDSSGKLHQWQGKRQRYVGTELPAGPSSDSDVGASQPLLDMVINAGGRGAKGGASSVQSEHTGRVPLWPHT